MQLIPPLHSPARSSARYCATRLPPRSVTRSPSYRRTSRTASVLATARQHWCGPLSAQGIYDNSLQNSGAHRIYLTSRRLHMAVEYTAKQAADRFPSSSSSSLSEVYLFTVKAIKLVSMTTTLLPCCPTLDQLTPATLFSSSYSTTPDICSLVAVIS